MKPLPLFRTIRIGTRGSKLARWQSDWVADELRKLGAELEIVEIATQGDVQQQGSVASLGIQGLFTKEIQAAVLQGRVDLAVHSLKDLPTQQVPGLALAATPPREDPSDALVTNQADTLASLPPGARVGTGSLRRRAQLLHLRPDLEVIGIRGNVDTRLRKLDEGEYDAIVLAAAGLERLGWGSRIKELLSPPRMLPAPGQGALGIECREDDGELFRFVSGSLNHRATRFGVHAERAVLAALHGGCSAPIAAWGRMDGNKVAIDALVADIDGRTVLRAGRAADIIGTPENTVRAQVEALAREVADDLLAQGAEALVDGARRVN
jgi:hydroxymethylbilane synthase